MPWWCWFCEGLARLAVLGLPSPFKSGLVPFVPECLGPRKDVTSTVVLRMAGRLSALAATLAANAKAESGDFALVGEDLDDNGSVRLCLQCSNQRMREGQAAGLNR